MLTTIVSAKGGQGKSSLSYAIAFACEGGIITNETHCSIDEILGRKRFLKLENDSELPEIGKDFRVVFDAKAGIDEPVVAQAIETADQVVIPVRPEGPEELSRLVWTIQETEKRNSNICVVVCRAKRNEFKVIKKQVGKSWNYPVFWMPNSVHVQDLSDPRYGAESLHEKAAKPGGGYAHLRKVVIPEFEALMDHLGLAIQR